MTNAEARLREAQRETRKIKSALRQLSNDVLLALAALDEKVQTRRDLPTDLGSWMGQWATALDMANDRTRYFALDVDFRRDDKAKAVKRLRARATRKASVEGPSISQSGEPLTNDT